MINDIKLIHCTMFQVSITRPQEREFERTERLSACFQDSDFGSAAICIIIVELI